MRIFFEWYARRMGLMLFLVASGIRKQTTFKKQSALGVPAIGAGGQILRRETSVFNLNKATFASTEIVSHQQSTGVRHGMQSPTGKLAGILSPGTYKLLMATGMRKDFVAGATTGALVNVTAAVTSGAAGTLTPAAGSLPYRRLQGRARGRRVGWAAGGGADHTPQLRVSPPPGPYLAR